MNLNDYLTPLNPQLLYCDGGEFLRQLHVNREGVDARPLEEADVVLLGVPFILTGRLENSDAPDLIRKELYSLAFDNRQSPRIYDLGNMIRAGNIRQTLFGLSDVLTHLLESHKMVVLLGGDSLVNLSVLRSLPRSVQAPVVYTLAEPFLSLAEYSGFELIAPDKIRFNQLGNQAHYHTREQKEWANSYVHETYRLGKLRSHLAGAEPYLRGSDGFAISANLIKNTDAPGQQEAYPNGIYGEDACQLAGFAGLADHLKVFSVLDYCPANDRASLTSRLLAQVVWYAIDGYRSRFSEHPYEDKHFRKFLVNLDDHSLVFYKSERTSRWWMEVPSSRNEGNALIPCHLSDYQTACQHEIPARWLRAYQRMNLGAV